MASRLHDFASVFDEAFVSQRFDAQGLDIASLSIDDAYAVQQLAIERRTKRGERGVGYKVGCTSAPIRTQFGLNEPICGRVMEPYVYVGDADLKVSDYNQPAIEPEFVLTMNTDFTRMPESDEELIDGIHFVSPGIELHHYQFQFGKPTLQELIASNGIHAGLVIGRQQVHPREIDWVMEGVGVFRDEQLVTSGIAADILGGPLESLRWLIAHLIQRGNPLRAGEVVIPGSAVELVPVRAGDRITARFAHAGAVTATFN